MSRVAKERVEIAGVTIAQEGRNLLFQGPLGTMKLVLHGDIEIENDGQTVGIIGEAVSALKGTFIRLIKNAVIGVTKGFEKQIKLVGVGYKAMIEGENVKLSIGFSHPVLIAIPEGVKATLANIVTISLKSCNKELLGIMVDRFCKTKKYNVYNGNGVLEVGKYYRRKETKKK